MTGDPSRRMKPAEPKSCQRCGCDCTGRTTFAYASAAQLKERGQGAIRWLCADCFQAEAGAMAGDAEEDE
jgi:hypothetical protein